MRFTNTPPGCSINKWHIPIVLGVILQFCALSANALGVDKTFIEIDLKNSIKKGLGILTVTNEKDVPIFVSSRIQSWKIAVDGGFELSNTSDINVTPGVANIAPNSAATFQVRYIGDASVNQQSGFRLTLTEMTRLNTSEIKEGVGTRAAFKGVISLPVFVTPAVKLEEPFSNVNVGWRAVHFEKQDEPPRVLLHMTNQGQRYVFIQDLMLGDTLVKQIAQYLLPGDAVDRELEIEKPLLSAYKPIVTLRYLGQTTRMDARHERE